MILRTYGCADCNHMMTVELTADQWNQDPPECPMCAHRTHQEFAVPAIGGSARGKAVSMALDIAERDYGVADIQADGKHGGTPKVRYRDTSAENASSWGMHSEALATAVSLGRETRLKHGSGLDVLQAGLKSGAQPDLIALSKKRSMRVW